ncbi:MAG TPA: TonB-dependent receptor [Burkholderiales bacterium]
MVDTGNSRIRLLAAALTLAGCGLSTLASAQEAGASKPGSVELSPVVVTATRVEEKSFDIPASIDAVERSVITDKKLQVLVSEDLQRVPGTVVQNRGTFSQEEQIIIRGFGARSQFGTRGVKIYADGIPATTPDGQSTTALFDLSSAGRIEVLRGAFSALYGNHSGGVVQIFTEDGPPQPTVSGRYTLGSYGTWVAGAQFSGTSGRANYVASGSLFATEGYRQWSGAQKDQFNGKVNFGLDNGGNLGLVFNYLDQNNNLDPLSLTANQVAVDRTQAQGSALQFKTRRNLDNTQGGLVYEQNLTPRDTLRVMGYLGVRSNEQFLSIPLNGTSQGAVKAAGAVSSFDRDLFGGSAWWTRRTELAGTPLTFTAGADYENAKEDRTGYLNNFGAIAQVANVLGALKRNEENTTYTWGVFAQGEWQFAPAWSLSAGLRYTKANFESDDRFICTDTINTTGTPLGTCSGSFTGNDGGPFTPRPVTAAAASQNPDDSGSVGYDAWTPVLGLLYRLSATTTLYANVGKSFETPTLAELAFRSDGGAGLNFSLQASTSWQYELGAKMFLGADTRMNAALFYIDTKDEVVTATNSGGRSTFQNAPGTRRSGAELSLDSRFGRGFSGYLAATYLNAEFTDSFVTCIALPCNAANPANSALVNSGNAIPNIPNYTVYGQLSWAYAPVGFSAGLEGWWQGKMYADDRNTATAGSYWIASLSAGFAQNLGGLSLSEFVRVNNLFDREYIAALAVNNTNGQFYYPAADRNYLVGITASYRF